MSETTSRLGQTVRDLLLACLNATLILVIVAFVLGLKLLGSIERIGDNLSLQLMDLAPVQQELQNLSGQVSGVRESFDGISQQLTEIRETPGAVSSEVAARLEPRLAELEARFAELDTGLAETRAKIGPSFESPEALVDYAIGSAADRFGAAIAGVRGCVPAGS